MAIGAPAASACWFGDKSDVTILYTNDVHTYYDKQSPKLTYAAIADLKQSYQNAGKDVLLVDAGDHVQGTAYGSMDEGASIIKLMNAAGYDVATPGNHEFDYGMDRAKAIMKEADFPYLSCNWVDLRTTLRVLPSVKVFVRGGRRIAFVGVTTPETFTKSTPTYFQDANGNYIYGFCEGNNGADLYKAVQKAIDDGYDRIVVILTRPKDTVREQKKDIGPATILKRTHPEAAEKLMNRYQTYNDEVALAKEYEKDGRVLILAPESMYGLNTLSKSFEGLERMYRAGYAAAAAIPAFLGS